MRLNDFDLDDLDDEYEQHPVAPVRKMREDRDGTLTGHVQYLQKWANGAKKRLPKEK